MILVAGFVAGMGLCFAPTPATDTPDGRLEAYYRRPDMPFCYKWEPDEKIRWQMFLFVVHPKSHPKLP